jgi:uncharacterized protein YjiS (DUF1127 family)
MQHIMSEHRQKVLAHLHALDPVQVQLSKRLGARTPSRILRWAHSLLDTAGRWRQRRATIRVLNALSDWQLADIGIHREEIPAAVDRALVENASSVATRPPSVNLNKARQQQLGRLAA